MFKATDIENFVKDHIQSKIDHNELGLMGIDTNNPELFKKEMRIYQTALFEGIFNGILMSGGEIEGIDLDEPKTESKTRTNLLKKNEIKNKKFF